MNKKVCMFVLNEVTNISKIIKECTALSEKNYEVDLYCISNKWGEPHFQKYNSNFKIYRFRKTPIVFEIEKWIRRIIKRNKLLLFALLYLLGVFLYFLPLQTAIFIVSIIVIWMLQPIWIKAYMFSRMYIKGIGKKYDIYQANGIDTLLIGYIFSKWRFKKKKLIYEPHNVQVDSSKNLYAKIERHFITKLDSVIVDNETRANHIMKLYNIESRIVRDYPTYFNDPFKKTPIREKLNLPYNEKILLYQGDIEPEQGIEQLILATRQLKEGTLVLLGDGSLKEGLEEIVINNNLQNKVKFIPSVPNHELSNYISNAYIGFYVPQNNNFNTFSSSPINLFEFITSGVPVISSNFPEFKKVIEGERVGVCIEPKEHIQIAEAVKNLIEDKNLHLTYQMNAIRVGEKYTWNYEKHRYLEVYDELSIPAP